MDRILAAAFIDNGARHRILGVRLQQFSVWHCFLLRTVRSPFVENKVISLFDIRTAVGICRLKFPDSKVRRPWLWPALAALRYGWSTKRWLKYLERCRDRVVAYCGDYISRPEWVIVPPAVPIERAGRGFPMTPRGEIPELMCLVADNISFLHCPEAEAWNKEVGRAYWYQMMLYRQKGEDVDFLDENEREFQALMKGGSNGSS